MVHDKEVITKCIDYLRAHGVLLITRLDPELSLTLIDNLITDFIVETTMAMEEESEIRRIAREVAREEIRDAERRGREYYRHRGKGSV